MANEQSESKVSSAHDKREDESYFFYVAQRIDSPTKEATGAEIKAMIRAVVPTFDPSHILVLEGQGPHGDEVIKDEQKVSLKVDAHEPAKHFYSKPPTNFGI